MVLCNMKSETKIQERQYFGLLGLDRLPLVIKVINFCISAVVGINLAFDAWWGRPSYIPSTFLPLVFAWPLSAIVIWLRLTGIKWIWCLVACGVIFVGYFILDTLTSMVAQLGS